MEEGKKTMTGVLAKEDYNIKGCSWKAIHVVEGKIREKQIIKEIRGNQKISTSIKSAYVRNIIRTLTKNVPHSWSSFNFF